MSLEESIEINSMCHHKQTGCNVQKKAKVKISRNTAFAGYKAQSPAER
mgnify:CR=1 FL=1